VVQIEAEGIDFPVVCRHCKERYCTKCPESAIQIESLGQVIVSATLCTGCGVCETLCPIGAIELYQDIPHVCDLCGGAPRCVEECTLNAIIFEPDIAENVTLEEFKKPSRGLSPEEKRVRYASVSAKALREKWLSERSG
jgi:Fe-S-cluster-containing hydrogenase component 2